MCSPVALFATSAVISVIGGAVQYKASKDAQRYNTAVANQNAKIAEAQAVDAERLGQIEAAERRLLARQQIATQQVGFAAQNVELTGSALDILGDTAMFGEIDERRIRENAARRAHGFRMDAYNIKAGDRLARYQGRMDRFGTILSTAANVVGAYGSFKGAGGWGGGGGSSKSGGYKNPVGG